MQIERLPGESVLMIRHSLCLTCTNVMCECQTKNIIFIRNLFKQIYLNKPTDK